MRGATRAVAVLVCLLESSRNKARRRAVLRRVFQLAFALLVVELPSQSPWRKAFSSIP